MKKLLRIYWPFSKAVIQEFMTYRLNFYIYIIGELFQTVVMLYIWRAVFNSSSSTLIHGFSYGEMVAYVFVSTITGMLINNDVHWMIGSDVRTGDIAMNLIKPVSYQLRMYASAFGHVISNFLFIALPLSIIFFIYNYLAFSQVPHLIHIGLFLVSCVFSIGILLGINYAFGLAAFYVNYLFGFIYAKETIVRFFSGAVIPLAFFPNQFQRLFDFLPFGSLIYTPVMIYLGKYSGVRLVTQLGIQLLWVVIMMTFNQFLWRKAVKRLSILGG